VSGDLHEVLNPHPGVGEDRDDVLPAGLSLRLDRLGYRSIRQHGLVTVIIDEPRGAEGKTRFMLLRRRLAIAPPLRRGRSAALTVRRGGVADRMCCGRRHEY